MGSSYVDYTFKDCSKAELEKLVRGVESQEAYESGRSYSGNLGSKGSEIEYISQVFADRDAARDYFEEHNDKWGPLYATRLPVFVKLTEENKGTKVKALETKVKTLSERLTNFLPAIVTRTLNAKSALKSCEHCTSKVNIKAYLARNKFNYRGQCPVCDKNLLLTNTDVAAQAKMSKDLETAKTQLELALKDRRKALTKTSQYEWYVGGWCSC